MSENGDGRLPWAARTPSRRAIHTVLAMYLVLLAAVAAVSEVMGSVPWLAVLLAGMLPVTLWRLTDKVSWWASRRRQVPVEVFHFGYGLILTMSAVQVVLLVWAFFAAMDGDTMRAAATFVLVLICQVLPRLIGYTAPTWYTPQDGDH